MGQPFNYSFLTLVVNSVNWNILIAEGKESKRDFLISGELKGNSLNLFGVVGYLNKRKSCKWNGWNAVPEKVESPVLYNFYF